MALARTNAEQATVRRNQLQATQRQQVAARGKGMDRREVEDGLERHGEGEIEGGTFAAALAARSDCHRDLPENGTFRLVPNSHPQVLRMA